MADTVTALLCYIEGTVFWDVQQEQVLLIQDRGVCTGIVICLEVLRPS